MNCFAAPCRGDVSHHRNHFEPSVRAALGLLDRAAEGQDVAACDIELALQVTGDAIAEMHLREIARVANSVHSGEWS